MNEFACKVIRIIYGIIVILTLVIVLFVDKNIEYSSLCTLHPLAPNLVLWLGAVAVAAGMLFLMKRIKGSGISGFLNRHFTVILAGCGLLLLLLELGLSYLIYFQTGWDVSIVTGMAAKIAHGEGIGDFYYYSQYVNNIVVTYLLSLVWKISILLGMEGRAYYLCIAAGCTAVTLAGEFTALSIRKATGSGAAGLAGFGILTVTAGLSPWITVPYTDVYSILFPALTFYLYISARLAKKNALWLWLGAGLAGGLGYLIKPSAGIVLIAVVLLELWRLATGEAGKRKQSLWALGAVLCAMVLTLGMKRYMTYAVGCELKEDLRFTFAHYLMLGLNGETKGSYSSEDYGFSSSFDTVEERKNANLQEACRRLKEYGPAGYADFLMRKLLLNYNDGTFSWWMEGGFHGKDPGHTPSALQEQIRNLFYGDREGYPVYATIAQGIWLMVLTALAGMILPEKGKRAVGQDVVMLSLIGIFFFVMLFEARARYLFCMLPMYAAGAACGVKRMYGFLCGTQTENL